MKVIRSILLLSVVLAAWIVGSRYVNPLFLPKPEKVLQSASELIANGMLQKSIGMSFLRISIATLLSSAISIPLGLSVASYRSLDQFVTPFTNLMRFIPVTVFYPLFIMWLGIGEEMKIAFLFAATFFFFLPTVILCMRDVDTNLLETAYTMGMSKFQVMYRVVLPASLPSISQNFLMMYGIGWTYIIIVEVINAKFGLGHIMNLGSARGRTDLVYVALFVVIIISMLFDSLGHRLIRRIFSWKFAHEIDD